MITELKEKEFVIQPKTGFGCKLLSADAPDPENPDFALDDGSVVWSIVMVDGRAPKEMQGEFVVYKLSPEEMLQKLQTENWEYFN
jgi:hypothetical protein